MKKAMDEMQRRAAAAAFALLVLGRVATALTDAESETGPVEVLSAAYRETIQLANKNAEHFLTKSES